MHGASYVVGQQLGLPGFQREDGLSYDFVGRDLRSRHPAGHVRVDVGGMPDRSSVLWAFSSCRIVLLKAQAADLEAL
jgi:hypothetical protein